MTPESKANLKFIVPSFLLVLAIIIAGIVVLDDLDTPVVAPDTSVTDGTDTPPTGQSTRPSLLDIHQFGSAGDDTPQAVAVDASGIYIVGDTEGNLDGTNAGDLSTATPEVAAALGATHTVGLPDATDAFIEKYSPDGSRKLWGHQFGTAFIDSARGVTINSTGIYVAGETEGALDGPLIGNIDSFIRKYTKTGQLVWSRQFGTNKTDEGLWVVSDEDRICLGGGTLGQIADTPHAGDEDIYVRCYDSDGNVLWTTQFGSPKFEEALGATIDSTGIYLIGATGGQIGDDARVGNTDAWMGKLSLDGELLFTEQFGSKSVDFSHGIAVDGKNIYTIGRTDGKYPGEKAAGASDAVIQTFAFDGNSKLWSQQFGTPGGDSGHDIVATASGVFAIGTINGAAVKHGEATNLEDGYLRHLSPTGKILFETELATSGYDEPRNLTVVDSTLYIVGRTGGSFEGRDNQGAWDIFLARYQIQE